MKAPSFEGVSITGKTLRLEDFAGKKLWLMFYRYAGCPLCQVHLYQVIRNYELFAQNGLAVVAIVDTPRERFPESMGGRKEPPLAIIADPAKRIYRQYGLRRSLLSVFKPQVLLTLIKAFSKGFGQGKVTGAFDQMPAHFLIREDGVVHTAYYGSHAADHIPWWQIERFLAEESVEEWRRRLAVT